MKSTIAVAILAIIVALAFTICPDPEKPRYVPYTNANPSTNTNTNGDVVPVRFLGGDDKTMLTGFWHLPSKKNNSAPAPVILLAHGLGLIQGPSLNSYVRAFQSEGYAVFTFDYATFGRSDGTPRHEIHPYNHVRDIQAAISMIVDSGSRNKSKIGIDVDVGIDGTRIGLWGTSLAGGHVLMAAAEDAAASSGSTTSEPSPIRAIVSQVPHIASGLESVLGSLIHNPVQSSKGVAYVLLTFIKYAIWRITTMTAMSSSDNNVKKNKSNEIPYISIAGPPGSAAILQNPGDEEGYLGTLNPAAEEEDTGWKNSATVMSVLRVLLYRPLNTLAKMAKNKRKKNSSGTATVDLLPPVLLIAAEKDSLCPAKYVQTAKEYISNAELITMPFIGHFDVYSGEELRIMLSAQVNFFNKHLKK